MEVRIYPLNRKDPKNSPWKYEIHGLQQEFSGVRPTEREARAAADEDMSIASKFCRTQFRQFDPSEQEG